MFSMERISIQEQLKNAEIVHGIRQKRLERAARKERVDLLITGITHSEPMISIIGHKYYADYFASAVPVSQMLLHSMAELPDTPLEMLIYDDFQVDNLAEKYQQIAKHIPDFINNLNNKCSKLPIYIYQSLKDFRNKKPTATVEFNKLSVTVEIDESMIKLLEIS